MSYFVWELKSVPWTKVGTHIEDTWEQYNTDIKEPLQGQYVLSIEAHAESHTINIH